MPNPYRRPLGPITHLRATSEKIPTLQTVELHWESPDADRVIDHYKVYGSRGNPDFGIGEASLVAVAPSSGYTHAGRGPDPETWHYKVVAVDAAGNVGRFEDSPKASATTAEAFIVGATASTTYSASYTPARAVDGAFNSRWSSIHAAERQWLQIELVRPTRIGRAELFWAVAYGKDYDILGSADGQTWRTLDTVTGGDGGTDELRFDSVEEVKYVRMQGVTRGSIYGWSLWEFWVHPLGS